MKFKALLYVSFGVLFAITGCKKDAFVEANTDPNILYGIKPEEQFLNAAIRAHNSDFEAYYDYYRRIMPWMQMNAGNTGNAKNFLTEAGNFNQRYGVFFPQLGSILTDVQKIIDKLPEAEKAQYTQVYALVDILKIYYAFYVSDINGSIPYTEAFQARYGGTTTPKYESQQELFGLWDARLKEVIATLKASPGVPQKSLGVNDPYFKGDVSKWAKAASALRVRMAMRQLKRNETAAKAIITDALSDPAVQMSSNEDSWVFKSEANFTAGGNFLITEFRAPKPTVDFMWENSDPRLRNFYTKNNYTQANLNAAIAAGVFPAGTPFNPRQYVGAHISPDSTAGKYRTWFQTKRVSESLSLDTVSYLQPRIWQAATNAGTGINTMPLINYADYAFMRAELGARNITNDNAETWYNTGVEASLRFFDQVAKEAAVTEYTAITATEITNYLNAADVKFNPATAIQQIAVQSYLNFYKQPNEAWALYKRTGYPDHTTALALERIMIDGTIQDIPRRAAISVPLPTDQNYETKKAALDQMMQDPGFGQPTDIFGRVWWDVE